MIASLRQRVGKYLRGMPAGRRAIVRAGLSGLAYLALRVLGWMRAPLGTLASLAGTDKATVHDYVPAYRRFLAEYRNRRVTLLEIGVGGYDRSDGGQSLRLWEAYFQRGTIVAIDLYDKTRLSHGRVHVHQCSQVDAEGLRALARQYDGFDIVIDDGSHHNAHQIETFRILFPAVRDPGIYVIEDTQTSYWPAFGGGAPGTEAYAASAMSYFKALVDGLNHAEFLPQSGAVPTPFAESIRGIYFEHNLIVILKGRNSAPSNVDVRALAAALERPSSVSEAGLVE